MLAQSGRIGSYSAVELQPLTSKYLKAQAVDPTEQLREEQTQPKEAAERPQRRRRAETAHAQNAPEASSSKQ